MPPGLDAFLAVAANPTTKENCFFRQVCGYGEMVAAFVVHGTLNSLLVVDTCQEMFFVYAKTQPYLADLREKTGMADSLVNLQKLVEGSAEGRARVARLQSRFAAVAKAPA